MDIYGQYVADRVIEYGDITTAFGIDRITGMPVLVFTSDSPLMAETEPPLEYPNLALTLEQGRQAERYFVVQALPMGYTQVKSLRGIALEHFYDGARAALSYLREKGRPHGAVRMNHLWWDGSHLLLAGAGLPWSNAATIEADVGALEGLVAGLAGTELSGGRPPVPPRLGFVPQSRESSSASSSAGVVSSAPQSLAPQSLAPQNSALSEGVSSALSPSVSASSVAASTGPLASSAVQTLPTVPASPLELDNVQLTTVLHSKFLTPREAPAQTPASPAGASAVNPSNSSPSTSGPPALSTTLKPPSHSSAVQSFSRGLISHFPRSPGEEVEAEPTLGRTPPPEVSEAQGVMRIGFEDDNSWRKVRSIVPPPASAPSVRSPLLLIVVGVLGVLAAAGLIAAGSYFLLRSPSSAPTPEIPSGDPTLGNPPSTPSTPPSNDTCCVVNFSLKRGGKPVTKQARLLVAESPAGSPLKAGDVLGIIPGPVRLPANPAKYSLLVQLEGFADQTLDLEMPSSQAVVIELP